jgi:hypothetical protein
MPVPTIIPDLFTRGADREKPAQQFHLCQRSLKLKNDILFFVFGFLAFNGMTNCPEKQLAAYLPLYQIILRPGVHRLKAGITVSQTSQHHDGYTLYRCGKAPDGIQALTIRQAKISNNDIVVTISRLGNPLLQPNNLPDNGVTAHRFLEHFQIKKIVSLIVFD